MSAPPPAMSPYRRHVFVCGGRFCDPSGTAERLYALLPRLLGDLAAYDNPLRVKRGIVPCHGVCAGGPLLVVYPDGVWYHAVDEAALRRIVDEHLRGGRVVEERVFHRVADA
jgi:(2Fe-2S) ferredoxin